MYGDINETAAFHGCEETGNTPMKRQETFKRTCSAHVNHSTYSPHRWLPFCGHHPFFRLREKNTHGNISLLTYARSLLLSRSPLRSLWPPAQPWELPYPVAFPAIQPTPLPSPALPLSPTLLEASHFFLMRLYSLCLLRV